MYFGVTKQNSNRLQTMFNYGCGIILHCPCLSSSSALWKDFCLSSQTSRRNLHLAELKFKCQSLAPSLLSSLFNASSPNYSTGKRSLVNHPSVKSSYKACLASLVCPCSSTFHPLSVRLMHSLATFKRSNILNTCLDN